MSDVLNYAEAAEWLRISRSTLERIVREGKIRPAYVYRRVLFTEDMLREFLKESAKPALNRRKSSRQVRA